jgi:ATP-dependent DNA ligase
MKASLSSVEFLEKVSNDELWAAGEKYDGYREQLHLGEMRNELFSSLGTSHIDCVPQFKVLVPELAGTVLDCEGLGPTNMLEDNAACFKADPANAIAYQNTHGLARLVTFDLLLYKGEEVMSSPFLYRRAMLEKVFSILQRKCFFNTQLQLEKLIFKDKVEYWDMITGRSQAEGHEGVILKRLSAPYRPGARGDAWLKVKRQQTVVCEIVGFIGGTGQFAGMLGSIHFIGEGGVEGYTSGMSVEERQDMTDHWDQYLGKKCIIECQEITRAGALRHPRYIGMKRRKSNENMW